MPDSEGFILRDPVRSGQILSGGWLIGYCSLESGSEPPPPFSFFLPLLSRLAVGVDLFPLPCFLSHSHFALQPLLFPGLCCFVSLGKGECSCSQVLFLFLPFPALFSEHCKEKVVPSRPFHPQASSLWENLGVCSFFFPHSWLGKCQFASSPQSHQGL